jgi:hypothetical protein
MDDKDARIAALEAELAERTRERDDLRNEKLARSSIDPIERLHNLCDGLAESRRESPYNQESWDLADACNRDLQAELTAERERREAAEKDAARYRWLRGDAPTHSERWPRWDLQRWDGRCWHSLVRGALDAAIDAAMKD